VTLKENHFTKRKLPMASVFATKTSGSPNRIVLQDLDNHHQ